MHQQQRPDPYPRQTDAISVAPAATAVCITAVPAGPQCRHASAWHRSVSTGKKHSSHQIELWWPLNETSLQSPLCTPTSGCLVLCSRAPALQEKDSASVPPCVYSAQHCGGSVVLQLLHQELLPPVTRLILLSIRLPGLAVLPLFHHWGGCKMQKVD